MHDQVYSAFWPNLMAGPFPMGVTLKLEIATANPFLVGNTVIVLKMNEIYMLNRHNKSNIRFIINIKHDCLGTCFD